MISDTFSGVDKTHITIFPGSEDVLVTGKMSIFGLLTCVFFFDATPVLPTEKELAKRRAKEEKERKRKKRSARRKRKRNRSVRIRITRRSDNRFGCALYRIAA